MFKTLRKGFLAVVLAVVALFTLASCVIGGTQQPTEDPTNKAQAALNEFTANVTFANAEAVTTSFNLPIAGKKGGFNIPISWSSSNEEVIAVVDLMENGAPSTYYKQAKVTRPAFDKEDATVTLTADFSLTYTKNDGTSATLKAQKTYTFVVVKETSEIASGNLAAIKAAAGKFYFEENGVAAGSSSPKELAFPVEFDATVTAVLGADGAGQFTVSDGSAGIYVYSNKTAVKVGDKVHVKGDITTYYGTLQVGANIEVTVLGASDQTIDFKPATPGEINAMPTADGMFGGQTIKATGTLLFGKYNGGSSDSFWLEDVQTGSQVELYYKSFTAAEKEALQAFAGKFVEIDVVTYDTYASSKPNDHRVFAIPSTCKEATAPEVTDADKLAAAVNKVKAVQLAALYVDGQEFAFPAVDGGEGVTITWAIDPAAVLVDGKLVVAENGTAKLIATVKVGELSETVELTINLAKEAKEEPVVTNKTVAELIALTTEMDAKYTVSGKVVKWGNKLDSTDTAATMYGNFILEDAEGKQIIVYGATATASALTFDAATGKYTYKNAKDFLTDALTKDIAVGDTVKLTVVRTSYNGNPQLNAIVVSVTKPGETELPTEGVVTLAQAIEIANKQAHNTYTTGKFTVTGKVSDLYNTVYGNMHLLDDAGNDLTIYGLYIEGSKYGDYTGTKPVEGDVITVTGILGTYNGTPQMKNADLVVEGTTPETPKHEHVACPTCGKCTAADCDGAAEDKCAGHSSTPEVPGENKTVSVVIKDYAAANGWVNGTMYNTLVMDSKVTVTMSAKGGSGTYDPNTGKYYTSGFEWRAYQSDKEATIVVSVAEGLTIVSVKISYNSNKNGVLVCNGTNVETNTVVEVNGSSVTFSVGNTGTATNGQAKVTAIEVVYGAGSAPETPEQPETPKHEHTLCATCGKCTAEDCDGTDKCAGHEVAPEEPTYLTVAEVKAVASGTTVAVKGVVIAKGTESLLIQDATGAIMLYKANSQATFADVKVGDEVASEGKYSPYNGLHEVANLTSLTVVAASTAPAVTELAAIDANTIESLQCQIVSIELTYVSGNVADKSNAKFTDANGTSVTVRGDAKWGTIESVELTAGDKVKVIAFVNWYNGAQLTNVSGYTYVEKLEAPAPEVPSHEHTLCATCGKCTAEDCDGTDKCAGHEVAPEEPETPEVAGGRADLETMDYKGSGNYTGGTGSYISLTSTNGWVSNNAALLVGGTTDANPVFKFIGEDNTTKAVTINGKTSAKGTLTSPTLTGGISKITFNYGHAFSDANGVDINITITEVATGATTVLNLKKAASEVTQKTAYTAEFVLETPVTGEFTIEFSNNSPSASTSNKDRVSLWNIVWEGAAEQEAPHVHTEEKVPGKEATCTEKGLTEGKKCSVCGETLVAQEEIAEKGHTEETVAGKEATCTEKGLTEGKKCSVCGETLVAQTEVVAKGHSFAEGKCTVCGADDPDYQPETPAGPVVLATFELGANGTASHNDGNDLGTSKSYSEGDYTLALTGMYKVFGPARDAKGNSCIKLGTSSVAGDFTFVVPNDVTEVVLYVAKYKTNTTKISVNGTPYTLTKNSNDGAYDEIKVDTTTNKTVDFATVSGGVRCMINTIVFIGGAAEAPHVHTEEVLAAKEATCTEAGLTEGKKCSECGETLVAQEEIAVKEHNFAEGKCSVCGADDPNYVAPEQPAGFTTHEAIVAEFLKDLNTFSSQEYTTVAAYWAEGTKTSFWKDDAMHAKWSWIFQYLSVVAKEQGIDTQYIDAVVNRTGQSGYALQNVAIFLLQINNDTWNTEYKETYGGLSSKWTTVDCTAVTFEAYSSYLPAEYFG